MTVLAVPKSTRIPGLRIIAIDKTDLIRFAKQLGFKDPYVDPNSTLMTGEFKILEKNGNRKLYGRCIHSEMVWHVYEVWEL
ncbi:MAG: hypothetical protein DRN26_05860 [Thermoplasmata archaeon]|nr:MAG: hypothetical protein DRN26_05860 [Thermoplasmata archaeon]